MALAYVGRAPDNDASVVSKGFADTRYGQVKVDSTWVASAVASAATDLKDDAYVQQQDNLRAKKTDVNAADALYVPTTQKGAASGVVPLDASAYVPATYLPTLQTNRKVLFVPASTVNLTTRTVTSLVAKEYNAASLTVTDPGFPYIPLLFATVQGGSINGLTASRALGTGSFGQVSVLDASDNRYAWGLATSHKSLGFHHAIPFAAANVTPTTNPPVTGTKTFTCWLGLWSGTTYTFNNEGFNFFCLVMPGF